MDVYELILERGCIGALSYANLIEKDNIKLASEIDEAVAGLIRIATNGSMVKTAQAFPQTRYTPPTNVIAPRANTPLPAQRPSLPNNNPFAFDPSAAQATMPQAPKGRVTQFMDKAEGVANTTNPVMGKIDGAAKLNQLAMYFKRVNWGLDSAIKAAMKEAPRVIGGTPSQAFLEEMQKISQIIASAPNAAVGGASGIPKTLIGSAFGSGFAANGQTIRGALIDRVLGQLGPTSTMPVISELALKEAVSDAVFTSKNWIPGSNKVIDLLGKGAKDSIHPVIKGMSPAWIQEADVLTGGVKGKTLAQIQELLSASTSPNAPAILGDLAAHTNTAGVLEKAVTLPSKSENLLTQLIAKVPGLKLLGKFLGPLAVLYEGWNLKGEVDTYGWDFKNICSFVSFLVGAASLIPPLAPVLIPLWAAMGVGCMFAHHNDDGNTIKDQNEPLLVRIQKRAKQPITLNNLDANDQALAKTLFNQYKDQGDFALKKAWTDADNAKKWHNYVDAAALLIKDIEEGGIFSPSEPIKPKGMDEPVVKAFNLNKYRLRTA